MFAIPTLARMLAASLAALAMLSQATAEPLAARNGYPAQPIRFISPFPPGGGNDASTRWVTTRLTEATGQPSVVENRGGAGGNIGAVAAARAPADGYTLLVNASIHVINPYVYASAPYDAFRDFEPVTQLVDVPLVLVVGSQLPVRNVQELIAWAKAHPGQVNFGSAGNASSQHLSGELFRLKTGAQMQHVPYKGSSPALTDLMGGQIQLMFDSMPSAMPFIASGRLRALAVTSASRSPSLPDVPTMAQAGVPGYQITGWHGIAVRAGTPPAAIDKLNATVNAIFKDPAFRTRWEAIGTPAVGGTAAEFGALIKSDSQRLGALVRSTGVTLD